MASIDGERQELQAKIVLAGVPFAGKEEILRAFANRHSGSIVHDTTVGESRILSTEVTIADLPEEGWSLKVGLHTVAGESDYNAVTELLIENLDALIFVCPVDPSRGAELQESLKMTVYNLQRKEMDLKSLPFTLHYRQDHEVPGLALDDLDRFLGLTPGALKRFHVQADREDMTLVSLDYAIEKLCEGVSLD